MGRSGGHLLDLLQGNGAHLLAPQLPPLIVGKVVPAVGGESAGEGERAQARERASCVLSCYVYTA